jgi:hypothetical protein
MANPRGPKKGTVNNPQGKNQHTGGGSALKKTFKEDIGKLKAGFQSLGNRYGAAAKKDAGTAANAAKENASAAASKAAKDVANSAPVKKIQAKNAKNAAIVAEKFDKKGNKALDTAFTGVSKGLDTADAVSKSKAVTETKMAIKNISNSKRAKQIGSAANSAGKAIGSWAEKRLARVRKKK